MKILLCAGLAFSATLAVNAATFNPGDVFVGGSGGTANGTIKHYTPAGVLVQTLLTGSGSEQTGMAFNAAGTLHATSFQASTMHRFDVNGNLVPPNPWLSNDANSHNESVVFDSAGNFYVGQADGTRDIIKRDANGNFLARYNVATDARGSDWIDLAADQSTMFYTGEGRVIKRYNVSTDTQLADFATLPGAGNAFALRLLDDGGLLVADRNDVKRLNAAGAVVQTYDTGTENFFFALNLDPNGTSFWTAGITSGTVYKFNIATGALETSFATGGGVTGLAIFGEITQGQPPPTGRVPETGTTALLLALALLALGIVRSRVAQE